MARVSVKMFATVREAAGRSEYTVDARNLEELISRLKNDFGPSLSKLIIRLDSDPEGLVILVNGLNIGRKDRSSVRLRKGDEVSIFPPVSGG